MVKYEEITQNVAQKDNDVENRNYFEANVCSIQAESLKERIERRERQ